MCKAADIKGHETNHSLRATGATELYTAGVAEKIIKERTGHRSLECLRMYERTSTKQHKAVSRVLSSSSGTNYSMEMSNIEHKRPETNAASLPIMNFNKCQVNINFNQPMSTTNTATSSIATHAALTQSSSESVLPSISDVIAFLNDIDEL